MRHAVIVLLALLILIVGAAYVHGSFDRPLSNVGLNWHSCARNGLGATFCGDELTEYRERFNRTRESVSEGHNVYEVRQRIGPVGRYIRSNSRITSSTTASTSRWTSARCDWTALIIQRDAFARLIWGPLAAQPAFGPPPTF